MRVLAHAHGRVAVRLVDAPAMGAPVRIVWRKRRWVCPDGDCPVRSFVEQDETVAGRRARLTTRAARWAIEQLRREHAPNWHHVSTTPVEDGGRGLKELTGMVDLSRDEHGRVRARLLDLVPGRSGQVYTTWLTERGEAFRQRVEIATLDPFHGYKNAIDDQFEDARSVLDAFPVVKLATAVVDDVRRRVQQEIHGHRGRKDDPLNRVRNILRAGVENLTERQQARLEVAWAADDRHVEVELAWRCAQKVRSAYHQDTQAAGKRSPRRSSPPSLRVRSLRSLDSARP